VVEGAALLLLVRKRRSFQRRGNHFKACCVTAAWFVTIAGFAVFTTLIK
jgi:hypothetical protein